MVSVGLLGSVLRGGVATVEVEAAIVGAIAEPPPYGVSGGAAWRGATRQEQVAKMSVVFSRADDTYAPRLRFGSGFVFVIC